MGFHAQAKDRSNISSTTEGPNIQALLDELLQQIEDTYLEKTKIEDDFLSKEDAESLYATIEYAGDNFVSLSKFYDKINTVNARLDRISEQLRELTK